MELFDISKYDVSIEQSQPNEHDEHMQQLLKIINDRSIPEDNKRDVISQFQKAIYLKSITMEPPKIILTQKKDLTKE